MNIIVQAILEILIDLGLIRADYKHRKKITKKEKEDGVKRPIQKHFLQPSTLITLFVLAVVFLSAFLFFKYQGISTFPKKTRKEILEISDTLDKWKNRYGQYPIELVEVTNGRPLRLNWLKDAWNRPYQYKVNENRELFSIISAGADGKFNTSDDIVSKEN